MAQNDGVLPLQLFLERPIGVQGRWRRVALRVLHQQEGRHGDGGPDPCQLGWVGDAAVQMVGQKLS